MKVLVVGCGLIGTSIALRLQKLGDQIWLRDKNESNLALARDLIGNTAEEPSVFDLIVIATPIETIIDVLSSLKSFNDDSTVIDVGGLKSKLMVEVEKLSDLSKIFVSAHPMAGREFSGPAKARADLFEGRAWIITPSSKTQANSLLCAKDLGRKLGATTYQLSAEEHDLAISGVSHLPQIISSLLGNLILDESAASLNFSGQGLRDVSRLADSDAQLWSPLLAENRNFLLTRIEKAIDLLQKLHEDLSTKNLKAIKEFLEAGKAGRAKIPGKHGAKARDYSYLPIVIDDKPGQLAKIFDECANCQVNVEDLSIEHSPNQETGLVTLALSEPDAIKLKSHLQSRGWLAQEIHE